jgi:hypothetical protein
MMNEYDAPTMNDNYSSFIFSQDISQIVVHRIILANILATSSYD